MPHFFNFCNSPQNKGHNSLLRQNQAWYPPYSCSADLIFSNIFVAALFLTMYVCMYVCIFVSLYVQGSASSQPLSGGSPRLQGAALRKPIEDEGRAASEVG